MRRLLYSAAAVLCLSATAYSDHYMQTADPQVVQAINEIINALGQGCNAGNANACQAVPMAQQQAHAMLSAGYDCQAGGNQQACGFYQQNLFQLQQTYQQVSMAHQSGALYTPTGGSGQGMGMGLTHEQRMMQIHNWGQERLQWGANNQAMMDANHQRFLETLRQ